MFKGLGDMSKMMKAAQEMQSKMAEATEKVQTIEAEGSAQGWRLSGYLLLLALCLPGFVTSNRKVHAVIAIVTFVLGLGWLAADVSS